MGLFRKKEKAPVKDFFAREDKVTDTSVIKCTGAGFSIRNALDKKRACGCQIRIDAGKNLVIFEGTNCDSLDAEYSCFKLDFDGAFETAAVVCPECGTITKLTFDHSIALSRTDVVYARMNNTVESARGNGVKPE